MTESVKGKAARASLLLDEIYKELESFALVKEILLQSQCFRELSVTYAKGSECFQIRGVQVNRVQDRELISSTPSFLFSGNFRKTVILDNPKGGYVLIRKHHAIVGGKEDFMKYRVTVYRMTHNTFTVEADTEEEAIDEAQKMLPSLCVYCDKEFELDEIEDVDVELISETVSETEKEKV